MKCEFGGGFFVKGKVRAGFLSVIIGISGLLIGLDGQSAQAQSLNEIQKKKAENRAGQQKKQAEIDQVKNEQAKAKKEVASLDAKISETTETIVEKQNEVVQKREEIATLEEEIEELEIRIAERDELLKERIAAMQVNGGPVQYIEVLLGAQSFGDFLDRVLALNTIAVQDRTIIEEQKADMLALETKKQEVEDLLANIESELEQLEKLKGELAAQLDEKDRLLAHLKSEEKDLHDELGELANEASLIAAQEAAFKQQAKEAEEAEEARKRAAQGTKATSRSSGSTSGTASAAGGGGGGNHYSPPSASGKLMMPTSGIYQRGFGGGHRGIDISNRSKPPIRAAASGTVTRVVTGCSPRVDSCGGGFGNYIVIAHTLTGGEQISTLYAHLDPGSISVSQGQSVSQGATIGRMGNTGRVRGATGIHLHFEVHRGGTAVNPERYF